VETNRTEAREHTKEAMEVLSGRTKVWEERRKPWQIQKNPQSISMKMPEPNKILPRSMRELHR
jgi:hypothetical protein